MSDNETNEKFGVWAILELMGHQRMAGYVTEETLFGTALGRIDVPGNDVDLSLTQYFGGHTIYRLTPVSEAVARRFAILNRPRPVTLFDLALPEAISDEPAPLADDGESFW